MKQLLLVALTLCTAACQGVGEGSKLERLRFIVSVNDPTTQGSKKVFECIADSVFVVGEFTDGSLGNFTNRVRYTSSNPAVVQISNGEVESRTRPGQFFNRGVLVPVTPGFASVTAEFAGLTASVEVEVGTPESITVTQTTTRMAPTSIQLLRATAKLAGVDTDVTQVGLWTFDVPNEAVATLVPQTGVVRAIAADSTPLTARIRFDACATPRASSTVDVDAEILVSDYALVLRHEPGYTGDLIKGTTELITPIADFGSGLEQDLSGQAGLVFSSTPADLIIYNTSSLLHTALVPGAPEVTATFGAGTNLRTSAALRMTVIGGTLQSLTIAPVDPRIAALGTQQFTATGSFLDTASMTRTQNIRRDVVWTSSDPAVASIISFTGFATALVAAPAADATVTIKAVPNALLTTITPAPEATSMLKICMTGSSC